MTKADRIPRDESSESCEYRMSSRDEAQLRHHPHPQRKGQINKQQFCSNPSDR